VSLTPSGAGFVGENIPSKHLHLPPTTFAYLIPQRSEAHNTFLDSLRCATHTTMAVGASKAYWEGRR
jgi:hypothetical protein